MVKRWCADPIAVVFDNEHYGQLFLDGEDDRFVELTLPGRRIANSAKHDAARSCESKSPGRADGRQALGGGRCHRGEYSKAPVRAVNRHHPATGRRFCSCEVVACQFEHRHPTRVHQRAIPIVEKQEVVGLENVRNRGQRFVPGCRDVYPAAPLSKKMLLSHVTRANSKKGGEIAPALGDRFVGPHHRLKDTEERNGLGTIKP